MDVLAEAGTFKTALDIADLGRVNETRNCEVASVWAEHLEEAANVRRASHRHDGDAIVVEIHASAHGQCFECVSIARTLHEYNRTLLDPGSQRGYARAYQSRPPPRPPLVGFAVLRHVRSLA
jgi:hypothetical protein